MAPPTSPSTRSRGAHFLPSTGNAVKRILDAAHLKPGESVLDVGAGRGSITMHLAAAVAPTGSVFAIENDPLLAAELQGLALPATTVVAGDALKVTLPDRIDAVVANPPYRILPGLLRRLLDHGFGRAVMVMPKELAERLTAQPKTEAYGKLTVEIGVRAKCKVLFPLRRADFDPPPQVHSRVVSVVPKPADAALDPIVLDHLLETAWAARKKTLRHSLAPLAQTLGLPPQAVTEAQALCNAGGRTAQDVSPWEYSVMAKALAAYGT